MSHHTRAARAAISRRVKNELVELLFETTPSPTRHHPSTITGDSTSAPSTSSSLSSATAKPRGLRTKSYSYNELRKAYLQKLQQIHPDKVGASATSMPGTTTTTATATATATATTSTSTSTSTSTAAAANAAAAATVDTNLNLNINDAKLKFQQLQSVWEQYEELVKDMQRVGRKGKKKNTSTRKNVNGYHNEDDNDDDNIGNAVGEMADFTQFGVGCSFSDSEKERQLRWEITDQACRGWFSSGLIPEQTVSTDDDSATNVQQHSSISLLDDDMFSIIDDNETAPTAMATTMATTMTTAHEQDFRRRPTNDPNQPQRQRRKTLIPGIS